MRFWEKSTEEDCDVSSLAAGNLGTVWTGSGPAVEHRCAGSAGAGSVGFQECPDTEKTSNERHFVAHLKLCGMRGFERAQGVVTARAVLAGRYGGTTGTTAKRAKRADRHNPGSQNRIGC